MRRMRAKRRYGARFAPSEQERGWESWRHAWGSSEGDRARGLVVGGLCFIPAFVVGTAGAAFVDVLLCLATAAQHEYDTCGRSRGWRSVADQSADLRVLRVAVARLGRRIFCRRRIA